MNKILRSIKYSLKINGRDLFNKPIKPRMVEFDLTKICNSRCQYCDIWKCTKIGTELTLEQIEKTFSDPMLSDVEIIIVTGGEPTTRPDLLQVYETLHKCLPNATLQLSTNAILKDRVIDIVKQVLAKGIKFEVGISLDGVGKDHDEVRRVPGNFDNVNYVINELALLKKQYPDLLSVCLGMTVSDLTVDKHQSIETYAKLKGLHLEYAWVEQTPFYANANTKIDVTKNRILEIVDKLPEGPRKEMWKKDIRGKSIRFKCYSLKTFFVLRYDGGIAPCLHYYDDVIGNVKDQTFTEIWTGEKANALRNGLIKNCKGCLNTWAFAESNMAEFWPYAKYYLTHPKTLLKELKK